MNDCGTGVNALGAAFPLRPEAPMARVTPPRPLDITALFPELTAQAATAVRLHPSPGEPGPNESSIGGPILWPRNEPWPTCPVADHPDQLDLRPLAAIRAERALVRAGRARDLPRRGEQLAPRAAYRNR